MNFLSGKHAALTRKDYGYMKLGIVGLPNVGKSTLFNALTNAKAESANYPFCTINPNVGIVPVPDRRLEVLANIYKSEKCIPATIEFVDIAGLVRGASRGEGLGNKFLSHIREVDAVVQVVRCFEGGGIIHVEGGVDPLRDLDIINLELIYSDMEMLERRIERTKKALKGDRKLAGELAALEGLMAKLEEGIPARAAGLPEEELAALSADTPLLTLKPVIYVANVGEDDIGAGEPTENRFYMQLKERADAEGAELIAISARIEAEIAELEGGERAAFLTELGIAESGLERLIKSSYSLLGLISYLTAGPKETRAWTIKKGTRAPEAAGKIHSDFERGFIRAEIVAYDDLARLGSMNAAKEAGLVRSEGKEYVICDGDVVLFRFNV